MKKILPALFCLIALQSNAAVWNVTVEDYQFSPATLNVMVGDTIHWTWVSGVHTTTSVTIPDGAADWNNSINSTHTAYDYVVTKPGAYSYECYFHSFLGMTASFTASSVVPVTLSAFTVTTKNNMAFLVWTTANELNADHFSIRRSIDGSTFKEIGQVSAAGTSSIERNYSFVDTQIPPGITYVYYTLAIIDKDGKSQLAPIKIYKNQLATPRLIIALSPNPVSEMGHVTLQYNADTKGILIATLIDMQGKTVLSTQLSSEPGINNGHIHLMNVSAGIYTVRFSLNGFTESYRLVKN